MANVIFKYVIYRKHELRSLKLEKGLSYNTEYLYQQCVMTIEGGFMSFYFETVIFIKRVDCASFRSL